MLICLTGFDKNGKTTMSNKIIKAFPKLQYYRSTHQRDKTVDLELAIAHDWRFFLDITKQVKLNIIFDRCFIDQFAYSQVYRQKNILKNYDNFKVYYSYFEKYCKELSIQDHYILYFYKENPIIIEDDFIDTSKMFEVLDYYKLFFTLFEKYLNIIYCKFEDGIEFNFNKISKKLKEINL